MFRRRDAFVNPLEEFSGRQCFSVPDARAAEDSAIAPHRPKFRVADAQTGWQLHTAAGGAQNAPIFFTIDEDISRDTWNNVALPWFKGINSVLGVQRTGVYGGIDVCQWAIADGVIGASSTPGFRWAWQTRAWSGNKIHPNAVLYQRIVATASNPGPLVGGFEVDVNDVMAPDVGQWNLHP